MIWFVLIIALTHSVHSSVSNCEDEITRDVCIIGGGSSGTFSAIQLQKAGKSVIVIERENVLGGHSNTYIDPKTKQAVDYVVGFFENIPVVKKYFEHLKVRWELSPPLNPSNATKFFDFSKGEIKNNVTFPDFQRAYQTYVKLLTRYPLVENGYFLSKPVPDDLMLPFGEFVVKYKIQEIVAVVWLMGEGMGDILQLPTLYVLKLLSIDMIQKSFVEGFILSEGRNNLNIYNSALKMLKNNVLLESHPIQVVRDDCDLVEVTVQTPTGCVHIKAKKLLVTIPPNNLYGFDLDRHETKIFSQFKNTAYFTGLVRNTGLPAQLIVNNINTNNPFALPTLSGLYSIIATSIPDIFDVKYCSLRMMSIEDVKADILASISKLHKAGIGKKPCGVPEFVAFNSHTPFHLTVSTEAIKNGFYDQLNGLQGKRNTYWTGAAFRGQDSGFLWRFTDEIVLPPLLESLDMDE